MDKQDKTADWYYKCCKCGKTLSLHSGITCTQPMAVRTSGICGGSTTQEITKEEYFETLYKWSEDRTAELEAKIKALESELHSEIHDNGILHKKVEALKECLEAADEVIQASRSIKLYATHGLIAEDYNKALEKYNSLKQ